MFPSHALCIPFCIKKVTLDSFCDLIEPLEPLLEDFPVYRDRVSPLPYFPANALCRSALVSMVSVPALYMHFRVNTPQISKLLQFH